MRTPSVHRKKIIFSAFSVMMLVSGIIGISRQPLRTKTPFTCRLQGGTVIIVGVSPKAREAGLRTGDNLVRLGGQPAENPAVVDFILLSLPSGTSVTVDIARAGNIFTRSLQLESRYPLRAVLINGIIGLLFWIAGVFIFLSRPLLRSGRIISWCYIFASFSIMHFWRGYPYFGLPYEYFLTVLYLIIYPLVPALFLLFCLEYPAPCLLRSGKRSILLIVLLPACLFGGVFDFVYLKALLIRSSGMHLLFTDIYSIFRLWVALSLLAGIGCLVRSYFRADTRADRNRVQWLLLGITAGVAPFILLWTIPEVAGFVPVLPEEYVYLFMVFIPVSFGISIVRYRAFDIEVIINRSIVYSIVTGLIVLVYLGLVGLTGSFLHTLTELQSRLLLVLFTLAAAVSFAPLRSRVQAVIDRTFYRIRYNYRLALQKFVTELVNVTSPDDVLSMLFRTIKTLIPVESVHIITKDGESGDWNISSANGGTPDLIASLRLILSDTTAWLEKDQGYLLVSRSRDLDGSKPGNPLVHILERAGVELVIPVWIHGISAGCLLVGKKLSGTRFTEEDCDLVIHILDESIVSLEHLRLQEQLILEKAEKGKLEELNRLKSEFVAHVSHELRTPLTAVRWSVDNLLDGIPAHPGEKFIPYLLGMQENIGYLQRMIENLLDVTKIEAGKIDVHIEKLSLLESVEAAAENLALQAAGKNITITVDIPADIRVMADGNCLKEILINLLDNAVKYSPENTAVEVSGVKDASAADMIVIRIKDRGYGIPGDRQKDIFLQFERIGSDAAAGEKGLGLGLYIVHKLVRAMGGSISVRSEEGKGSEFAVTLPSTIETG